MKCPNCDVTLQMSNREGIEIDYCPECRGVWLDRGELDKIIERSESWSGDRGRDDDRPRQDDRPRDDDRRGSESYGKPKKKKSATSFVGDLFESFGG